MSRERRNRRIAEIVKGAEKLLATVELIARHEKRSLANPTEFERYIADLRRRKVLVDLGTHPDGRRRLSFRFDRLGNGIEISMNEYLTGTTTSDEW